MIIITFQQQIKIQKIIIFGLLCILFLIGRYTDCKVINARQETIQQRQDMVGVIRELSASNRTLLHTSTAYHALSEAQDALIQKYNIEKHTKPVKPVKPKRKEN